MAKVNTSLGPNVRHSRYIIVENKIVCPHCSLTTAVFALALPAGYESLNPDDDMPENQTEAWERTEFAAVLSYIQYLPDAVINRVGAHTAQYRMNSSSEGRDRFWKNHCEHCQEVIEEELLHEDLDSAFGSMGAELSGAIQLHQVREPFEAWAGGAAHDIKALDG
jgi:hypothetical protein